MTYVLLLIATCTMLIWLHISTYIAPHIGKSIALLTLPAKVEFAIFVQGEKRSFKIIKRARKLANSCKTFYNYRQLLQEAANELNFEPDTTMLPRVFNP